MRPSTADQLSKFGQSYGHRKHAGLNRKKKPLRLFSGVGDHKPSRSPLLTSPLLPLPSVSCPPIPSLWVTPPTEKGGVGKRGGRVILISQLASAVSQQQPFSTFALPSERNYLQPEKCGWYLQNKTRLFSVTALVFLRIYCFKRNTFL